MSQYTAEFLLRLLDGIEIPGTSEFDACDVDFKIRDGWAVTIFYDCGELDYIDHFVSPTGEVVDFWKWDENVPGFNDLINWRGHA